MKYQFFKKISYAIKIDLSIKFFPTALSFQITIQKINIFFSESLNENSIKTLLL